MKTRLSFSKGNVVSGFAVFAIIATFVGLMAFTFGIERLPGLEDELRERTIFVVGERIETTAYAANTFEQAEIDLKLTSEYQLEYLPDEGRIAVNYNDVSYILDPLVDISPDPDDLQDNNYLGESDIFCLEQDGDTTFISGGEC